MFSRRRLQHLDPHNDQLLKVMAERGRSMVVEEVVLLMLLEEDLLGKIMYQGLGRWLLVILAVKLLHHSWRSAAEGVIMLIITPVSETMRLVSHIRRICVVTAGVGYYNGLQL